MDSKEIRERRKYERFPFKQEILIDGRIVSQSLNICEDGMFLCTLHQFEKDNVITLTISSHVTVKAVVMNYQPGIGMGVKFIDLNNDQKAKIKNIIEHLKK
jgi:hypothetical protein